MATFTLHKETVQSWLPLSRFHILSHFLCVLLLFYYRIKHLIIFFNNNQTSDTPKLPWILMTLAEIILSIMWFFNQAYRWRPVSRSVMTEKLPADDKLPGLDIFVCTIDPEKEPTMEVMNTVVSAIAMDYPCDKLSVYLSDDGASPITHYGIKEASQFAKFWVPFCRKYGVKSRCPKVFFSPLGEDDHVLRTLEFEAERDQIKVFIFVTIIKSILKICSLHHV